MSLNELRKDYILDRWVVIASQRKRRPTDFIRVKEERKPTTCPFCPGNEHMTPPATLVYQIEGNVIVKKRDRNDLRYKNWVVRCIPNLYPAFSPPEDKGMGARGRADCISREAVGHHEVLIESPNHDEHPSTATLNQLIHVIHACRDRFRDLSSQNYVKYVSIFRNHGPDAGASLSHAHTQIIATPIVPSIIEEELTRSKKYYMKSKRCVFCEILHKERESERFIWENDAFIIFAPWASVHPFEFWIFPKMHEPTILDTSENDIKSLALAVRVSFGGLRTMLDDPSYNFGFHMTLEDYYHWHIEVYPRLAIWAGFEKSTGIFINVMSPEEAAGTLREFFKKEEENLKRSSYTW